MTVKEFSHDLKVKLTPYLAYNLKFVSANKKPRKTFFSLSNGLTTETNKSTFGSVQYTGISEYKIFNKNFLPVLKPISDLTIEFINTDVVLREFQPEFIVGNRFEWNYAFVQRLFELHLDYFSLIDKGFAISIHDVEQVIA